MTKLSLTNVEHIVGHKGYGDSAPENSLIAFQMAADAGLTHIEFDVRLTRDGVAVLANKDNLFRVSGVDINISETDYADLVDLDIASYHGNIDFSQGIPTLEQALKEVKRLNLRPQIELKSHNGNDSELAEKSAQIISASYSSDEQGIQPLITSFSPAALNAYIQASASAYQHDHQTGLLVHSEATDQWSHTAAQGDYDFIHIFSKHITPAIADAVQAQGYGLNAYKMMGVEDAIEALNLGAQRFTTDVPELFLADTAFQSFGGPD